MDRLAVRLDDTLAGLERDGLRRERRILGPRRGGRVRFEDRELVDFSSNDYLGLASHPRLAAAAHEAIDAFGTGSAASPLVSGHSTLHEEAEARFAAFVRQPRALLFASGYAANLGILATFCDREAEIFADRLNHACLVDGALLSRAKLTRYPHLDVDAVAAALAASTARTKVVATDAVFSMDGDVAPLGELLALCEAHDAWLVVDDAHGIGVLGRQGRGTLDALHVASDRIVSMATLGKALGGYGAFVAGSARAIDVLLQRARTYVFSTALPPACAATASAALRLLEADDSLVAGLHARIARFRAGCAAAKLAPGESRTAIHPLVLGAPGRAIAASRALLERGLLVPAIRPPTVPHGTSRLRISLSAAHGDGDIDSLVAALAEAAAA